MRGGEECQRGVMEGLPEHARVLRGWRCVEDVRRDAVTTAVGMAESREWRQVGEMVEKEDRVRSAS